VIEIKEEPANLETTLEYGVVSIAFLVESLYRVEHIRGGLGGWRLTEEPVEHPYIKTMTRGMVKGQVSGLVNLTYPTGVFYQPLKEIRESVAL